MTKEKIKEIAWIAWKGAANAFKLYPENAHTFSEYWNGAQSQFSEYVKPNAVIELPSDEDVEKWYIDNIDKDCSASSAIYKFRLWLKHKNIEKA